MLQVTANGIQLRGRARLSKTPGDDVTPVILQRGEAKLERSVTWGFAGRWQARG